MAWTLIFTKAAHDDEWTANALQKADTADTTSMLTVGEQTLVGRITGGTISALTPTQIRTLLNITDGATPCNTANVDTAGAVMKSTYNAHTILYATTDDTPAALTVNQQTVVGRLTGGNISAIEIGIADNYLVQIDSASVTNGEYARFTAAGLESRSTAEALSDIGVVQGVEDAGLVMTDTKNIEFETVPSASHTANGIVVTLTAGTALAFGDACYPGTDGKMEKALADDAAITIPATHLCIATISENSAGLFLERGYAHDDSWSFNVGKSVYLSAATAGLITKTMPTKVTGNQVQVLGTCVEDASIIYWNPSPVIMEYA